LKPDMLETPLPLSNKQTKCGISHDIAHKSFR